MVVAIKLGRLDVPILGFRAAWAVFRGWAFVDNLAEAKAGPQR
jgi:hypothetical protein